MYMASQAYEQYSEYEVHHVYKDLPWQAMDLGLEGAILIFLDPYINTNVLIGCSCRPTSCFIRLQLLELFYQRVFMHNNMHYGFVCLFIILYECVSMCEFAGDELQ